MPQRWTWDGSQQLRLTYGLTEIGLALEERRQTVAQWHHRGKLPPPHDRIAAGPLWFSSLQTEASYVEEPYLSTPPTPIDFFIADLLFKRLPTGEWIPDERLSRAYEEIYEWVAIARLPPLLIALIASAKCMELRKTFADWRAQLEYWDTDIPLGAIDWMRERMSEFDDLAPSHWP